MKKLYPILAVAASMTILAGCGSERSDANEWLERAAQTTSVADRCGVPSVSKLAAIAAQFDPKFKDEGILDAFEYRIDGSRSVVSATVKRPTNSHIGTEIAWLMSGDDIERQLTGQVDLSNPLSQFVAEGPLLPGAGEQWQHEWRACDDVISKAERTSWTPPRSADLATAPPTCEGAESLDKVPGIGFKLKDGYKLIDIYRAYGAPSESVVGGNVADSRGSIVARGAVWRIKPKPRSANLLAAEYSDYRKLASYNVNTEKVAVVERCAKAVPH